MTHKQYDCNAHNTISKETSDKMKLNDLRRQNLEGHNSCQFRSMGSLVLTDPTLRERAGEGGGGPRYVWVFNSRGYHFLRP